MILFRPDMAQAILEGRKTVTRRRGKCRWRVGAEHLCYTRPAFARPPGRPFAKVRIERVDWEMRPMREARALDYAGIAIGPALLRTESQMEGFNSWEHFREAYMRINGPAAIDDPCWRVQFALVEQPEGGG